MSPNIEAKVSWLRRLLLTETDLAEVSEYFHTVLVPDDEFLRSSTRTEHPRLLTALEGVLRALEPAGRLSSPVIVRVGPMCHGNVRSSGGQILFLYFEELDLGFCSYCRSLTAPEVTFVSFHLKNLTGSALFPTRERGSA